MCCSQRALSHCCVILGLRTSLAVVYDARTMFPTRSFTQADSLMKLMSTGLEYLLWRWHVPWSNVVRNLRRPAQCGLCVNGSSKKPAYGIACPLHEHRYLHAKGTIEMCLVCGTHVLRTLTKGSSKYRQLLMETLSCLCSLFQQQGQIGHLHLGPLHRCLHEVLRSYHLRQMTLVHSNQVGVCCVMYLLNIPSQDVIQPGVHANDVLLHLRCSQMSFLGAVRSDTVCTKMVY